MSRLRHRLGPRAIRRGAAGEAGQHHECPTDPCSRVGDESIHVVRIPESIRSVKHVLPHQPAAVGELDGQRGGHRRHVQQLFVGLATRELQSQRSGTVFQLQ